MNLVLRMKEIDDRLGEIRGMVEKEEDMKKLEDMEKETDKLQEERKMIEKKMSLAKMTEIPVVSAKNTAEQREMLEKRGKDLMESRTIKVSSDEVLMGIDGRLQVAVSENVPPAICSVCRHQPLELPVNGIDVVHRVVLVPQTLRVFRRIHRSWQTKVLHDSVMGAVPVVMEGARRDHMRYDRVPFAGPGR